MNNAEINDHLGRGLSLSCLLCGVLRDTLSFDAFSLCVILFIVGSEKINLIVVIFCCSRGGGSSRSSASNECLASSAGTRQRCMLSSVGLDVSVPSSYVGEFGGIRCRCN